MLKHLHHHNNKHASNGDHQQPAADDTTTTAPANANGSRMDSPPVSPRQNKWNLLGKQHKQQQQHKNKQQHKHKQHHDEEESLSLLAEELAAKEALLQEERRQRLAQLEEMEALRAQLEEALLQSETPVAQRLKNHHVANQASLEHDTTSGADRQDPQEPDDTSSLEPQTTRPALDRQAQEQLEALRQDNESLKAQLEISNLNNNNNNNAENPNKEHQHQVEELQQQLTALRHEHAAEMDDILAQLDLVEAEHAQQVQQAEITANEQRLLVAALSTELHTLQHAYGVNGNGNGTMAELQEQLADAHTEIDYWKDKYASLKADYQQAKEQADLDVAQAAEEARQDMMEQAEAQFSHANQLYVQLQQDYAECKEEMSTLQHQLEQANAQVAHEQQVCRDKVTQLEHELQQIQQIAVHDKSCFKTELERFQSVHDALQEQLQQAEQSHQTLERTLAMLVMEKEVMAKENADLKGVCEETMALLESYQQREEQGLI